MNMRDEFGSFTQALRTVDQEWQRGRIKLARESRVSHIVMAVVFGVLALTWWGVTGMAVHDGEPIWLLDGLFSVVFTVVSLGSVYLAKRETDGIRAARRALSMSNHPAGKGVDGE